MTRHQDGDRVGAASIPDRSNGSRIPHRLCHLPVGPCLPQPDPAQDRPDLLLELSAVGKIKRGQFPGDLPRKRAVQGLCGSLVPTADPRWRGGLSRG